MHEAAVARLLAWLVFWGDPRKARVYASELKLRVGERRGRKPDLSVYFAEASHPGGLEHVACVPPSIVVEVVSKRPRDVRRDRIEKLGDYARFGVPWFWLLDPFRRTFEVLELAPDGRYVVALAAESGAHAAPGCDGLVIDLDDLWRRLDELPG